MNYHPCSTQIDVQLFSEPLAGPQEYVLFGGENVTTEIAVYKGPGKRMKFDPITLFLRSSCSGEAVETRDRVTVPATAEMWNEEENGTRSLLYHPPCPAIRWGGRFAKQKKFVYTGLTSLVEVSVFNEVC